MFKKKGCKNCGEKIKDNYEFCPHCGNFLAGNKKKENEGMLGKEDSKNEFDPFTNSLFGGISGKMINKMLGSAMKMLEKEMRKEMQNPKSLPKTNFELRINGKKINPDQIKVSRKPIQKIPQEKREKQLPQNNFSQEKLKKFSLLPRKEPSTEIKRLPDKVIYEIKIPGVKSIKDILISKLENSIEIKALARDKVYSKTLPINLPITDYSISKGKLILELEANS